MRETIRPELYSYDIDFVKTNHVSDSIGKCVEERLRYLKLIELVKRASVEADPYLSNYILKLVTEGRSYNHLKSYLNIPCSKDMYYDRYR